MQVDCRSGQQDFRDRQGKVWLSADGTTWSRVADDEIFDGVALRRVTAFDDGLVALGTQGRKLVSFHSPDGRTWTRTTIDRVGTTGTGSVIPMSPFISPRG